MKQMFSIGHTHYKDILYHVNKDKPKSKNILKIKESRRKIKVLTKEEIQFTNLFGHIQKVYLYHWQ